MGPRRPPLAGPATRPLPRNSALFPQHLAGPLHLGLHSQCMVINHWLRRLLPLTSQMRGSQVQGAGDLSPCPSVQAEVVTLAEHLAG